MVMDCLGKKARVGEAYQGRLPRSVSGTVLEHAGCATWSVCQRCDERCRDMSRRRRTHPIELKKDMISMSWKEKNVASWTDNDHHYRKWKT